MTVLLVKIFHLEKRTRAENQRSPSVIQSYQVIKQSLQLYPAALFVCWVPHMVSVIVIAAV